LGVGDLDRRLNVSKLAFGFVGFLVMAVLAPVALMTGAGPALAVSPVACTITGQVSALSAAQSRVVETIAGRAELTGDPQAAVALGIDVSLALTNLVNLAPTNNVVGIFAFDPNGQWGPVADLSSASEDTVLFMAALEATPGWSTHAVPAEASSIMTAYGVAVPATPRVFNAVLKKATSITKNVLAMVSAQDACGAAQTLTLTGVGRGTLPAGYSIPASATAPESEAVAAAISQIGDRYVWGGASPTTGFDCSGLTMWAWGVASPPVKLDHYTVSQWEETVPLPSLAGASPGDLVLVPGSDGTLEPANPQHVGMYVGDVNGVPWVVAAADAQLGVIAQSYASFVAGGLIAVGHITTTGATS
jgi:cell wall-associated NlpC family hydrolase